MVMNLGFALFILIAQIIYTLFVVVSTAILTRINHPVAKRYGNWFKRQQDSIFFNGILATIDGLFVVVAFAAVINIKFKKDAGGEDLSYVLSVISLIIWVLYLLGITTYMMVCKPKLAEETHLNRSGYVHGELNHKNRGRWALTYPLL